MLNESLWNWSHLSLTAELQSKFWGEFISFIHSLLLGLIITDAMALVLEFQCLMHPAVAIHSLPEFDGVKHNEKDDLMDFNLDCHWKKKFCNFHYQEQSLLNCYFCFPKLRVRRETRGCIQYQLCQLNWENLSAHTQFVFAKMLHWTRKGQRAFHFHDLMTTVDISPWLAFLPVMKTRI